MKGNKSMKTITNIIFPAFAVLGLGCFAFSPAARAVCQNGCLSNSNTALGEDALISLSSGTSNTALGYHALFSVTTAFGNTATGKSALFSTTTGGSNTATGQEALLSNTTGFANTATGSSALESNTTGTNNTANGTLALLENTIGTHNTAMGDVALVNNSSGNNNTACGTSALGNNLNGNGNIALGFQAGGSLTTGSNNIDIGNRGVLGESNTIRIGTEGTQTATFIAGIRTTAISGIAVGITPDGQLGTRASSKRFKDAIQPMDKASEAILALKPVTFRYKPELDPDGIPQFGLVAEQVEKVNPDLVARDSDGKPYAVRYEAINAMLLNEFLKEHRKVQELEATTTQQDREVREQEALIAELTSNDAQQQREIKALAATVKEQASQIQKVTAQLAAGKPAPRVVANDLHTIQQKQN
jgi:trimeric autotransporter adhesin